jgi:hypothetical protein
MCTSRAAFEDRVSGASAFRSVAGLRQPEGEEMSWGLGSRSLRAGLLTVAVLSLAPRALATITLAPTSGSAFPSQSVAVTATITSATALPAGFHPLVFAGLPAGVTISPANAGYNGSGLFPIFTATVNFQFVVAATTPSGGPYTITVRDTVTVSQAFFSLTVNEPTLRLQPTTSTITLGASPINVSVRVLPDPGFGLNAGGSVPLTFAVDQVPLPPGMPANVTAGGTKNELAPYNNTLTFPFSRTGPVTGGSYAVPLTAVWTGTRGTQQTSTASVTLNIPDVAVTPPAPAPVVCNGGLVVSANALFTSQYGYTGTAIVGVVTNPPGTLTIPPKTVTLANGQSSSQPFTVQAAGAALGNLASTVRLQDAAAAVDKTFPFPFRVINPDVTASTTSSSISIQAGGASQAFTANTAGPPVTCNAFNQVDYTVTGLPAGFTTPGTVSVNSAPGVAYPAATLPISAGATVAPGSYPANVHFVVPQTGQTGNLPVTVNVSAGPDFSLGATPNPITIPQGQSGTVAISLTALNGFTGAANVTVPAIQSVTASPTNFGIVANQPVNVVFTVAANATPGTIPVTISGTAAGVPGARTVTVNIVVPPPPDFTLTASPTTLTLPAGGTGKITFTMTALNGWNSPTTLSIPSLPNVTAVPTTGPFPGTGGSIDVFFTAAPGAPNGTIPFTATATALSAGPPITRSANATLVIQPPPDFSLTVAPLALSLFPGDTGSVAVTANPLYGFSGSVSVSAPALPGITFTPSVFTLAAGGTQVVQVASATSAALGTTTATFTGTAGALTHRGSFQLTLSARPDFALQVTPASVTIGPTGTAKVTVLAAPLNGFAAPVDVAAPTIPGITFNPATFTLPPGGAQTVDVVGNNTPAGTFGGNFTGLSGAIGPRTAAIGVTVTGAPDFQVQLAPSALVLPAGATGTTNVSIVVINGLGGTFNVTVAPPAGLTISPTSFSLAPGAVQAVQVTAGASATGTLAATFTGTSTQTGAVRTAALSVTVPRPDYALTLSPSSLRIAPGGSSTVAVTAVPANGFTGVVTVVPALPAGVDVDLKSFTLGPGESKVVTVSLAAGTPAGFLTLPFNGTTPGGPSHSASLPISVETAPDFTLAVTPTVISLPPGGRAPAQVTLIPLNGWSGGVDVTATASSGITIVPPSFPLQPLVPFPVEVRAADDAAAGQVLLTFRASGANGGAGVTVTRTINVQVTVAPTDFNVRVTPPSATVVAGRTSDLSFLLEPLNGFAGTVVVTPVSLPAGVTITPPAPRLTPNVPQAATLSVPRTVPPGPYTLVFRADEVPGPTVRRRPTLISKTVNVPLTVQPAGGGFTVTVSPLTVLASPGQAIAVRYEIRSLSDTALTIAGDSYVLRDETGNVLSTVEEPLSLPLPPRGALTVSNTVLVTGEQFAKAGSPPIVLADRIFRAVPDETGFTPTANAVVTVTAANSLIATASATRISIVYPPTGTLIGRGDSLRAQGLIVGSGTGNLLVGWFYDGVLVETATVPLQNGTPTSVSNAITLPTLVSGNHEIVLSVLAPNTLSAPAVQIYVEEGQRTLRLVSPTAGAVLSPAFGAPTFSWIPVPGIARYGVGLRRRTPGAAWRWTYTTDTRWSPPASLWNSLPEGDYEWGVRGFTNTSRAFLDSLSGGASAPPTSEGSPEMAEGWTVTSAQGRFSIGGAEAALQNLEGQASLGDGGVRFVWKEIPGALYVHTLYEQAPDGLKRVRTEVLNKPGLLIPTAALPRGGPFVWRVSAMDKDGHALGAMAAAPLPVPVGAR